MGDMMNKMFDSIECINMKLGKLEVVEEEYMEKNMYICKNQHGFRKGKGTDTAVMELVRDFFANINKDYVSSIIVSGL